MKTFGIYIVRMLNLSLKIGACLFLSSCVSLNGTKDINKYSLQLKPQRGQLQKTTYSHVEKRKIFFEGILFDTLVEKANFQTEFLDQSNVNADQINSGHISGVFKSVNKNGNVSLRDLGFPELNQPMFMAWNQQGHILRAGDEPKESIFYVPSVPYPPHAVALSESWSFSSQWFTDEGIPLQLEAAVILKSIVKCGSRQCANLEISGNTAILPPYNVLVSFGSELKGSMLVDLETGLLFHSVLTTQDRMFTAQEGYREVESCLEGVTTTGSEFIQSSELKGCAP